MMAGHECLVSRSRRPVGSQRTVAAPRTAGAARWSPAVAGVWEKLHTRLLNWLGDEAAIDWSRASVDSLSVRAKRGASRRVRTRSTAANPAPSTTSSSIVAASRCPFVLPRPMPTTQHNCSRWSTPSRGSSGLEGDRGDHAGVLPSCMPTRRTTPQLYAAPYVFAASPLGSPVAASTPASGWGDIDGWWNGRSPGCLAAVGSGFATSGERTSSRVSSTWAVP